MRHRLPTKGQTDESKASFLHKINILQQNWCRPTVRELKAEAMCVTHIGLCFSQAFGFCDGGSMACRNAEGNSLV